MKIAILAWGSLIWDQRNLAIASEFKPVGPPLPIEFCRVSADRRLTLVIDESIGVSCRTYIAESALGDLNAALANLWTREGSPDEVLPKYVRKHGRVGFVEVASGDCSNKALERHPNAVVTIKAWAQANGFEAAIWTALANNFREHEKTGELFSVEAATRYLGTLDKDVFALALQYIQTAPPEVQTPVRAATNAHWPVMLALH